MAQSTFRKESAGEAGRLIHVKDLWVKRQKLAEYVLPLKPKRDIPPQPSEVQAAAAAVLSLKRKSVPDLDLTDPRFREILVKAGVQIAEVVDGDVLLYGKEGHDQAGVMLWQGTNSIFAVPYSGIRKRAYSKGIGFIHMIPAAEEPPIGPTNRPADAKPPKRVAKALGKAKPGSVDKGQVQVVSSAKVEGSRPKPPLQPKCGATPVAKPGEQGAAKRPEQARKAGKPKGEPTPRQEAQGVAKRPEQASKKGKQEPATRQERGVRGGLEGDRKNPNPQPTLAGSKGKSDKAHQKPSQSSQTETGSTGSAKPSKPKANLSKLSRVTTDFMWYYDEIVRDEAKAFEAAEQQFLKGLKELTERCVIRSAKIYFDAFEVAEKTWRGRLTAQYDAGLQLLEKTFFSYDLGKRIAVGHDLPPATEKTEWYCAREETGHPLHRKKAVDISAFRRWLKPASDLLELRPSILCGRRIYSGTLFYSRNGSPANGRLLGDGLWNPAELKGFEMDCGKIAHLRFIKFVRLESELVSLFSLEEHISFHLLPGCLIKSPVFRISDRSLPSLASVKGPTADAVYRMVYAAVTAHAPREVQALISLAKMEEFSLPARSGVEPSTVAMSVCELERKLQAVWPNDSFDLK